VWWLIAAEAVAFSVSTLPFLVKVIRRDSAVLVVAPLLLICRAAALGLGLAAGVLSLSLALKARR